MKADGERVRAYPDISMAWSRLKDYLGARFDPALTDYATCCEYSDREVARLGDRFYRDNVSYLYELTHFHFSPDKDGFFKVVNDCCRAMSLHTLADFGCGIGLDAQALISSGREVTLLDVPSRTSDYLQWRFRRDLRCHVSIHDPYEYPRTVDLAYSVDVLEHTPAPCNLARALCRSGRFLCVNLFPHDTGQQIPGDLHFPLNHWEVLPAFDSSHQLVQVERSSDTLVTLWKRRQTEGGQPCPP